MKFFAGGEHFYSPSILFAKKKFDLDEYINQRFHYEYKYYTGGGIHSLFQLLKHITFKGDEYCLLPSYLCPTIIKPFQYLGINYKFFKIDKNLQIDTEYLQQIIDSKCKAILFINYFGFPISKESEKLLLSIQKKGIYIIQDLVQSFFSDLNLIGDFCFNSFRKFLPVDGSVILSRKSLNLNLDFKNYQYFFLKSIGQFFRYCTYKLHIDFSKIFLWCFQKSDDLYYLNFNLGFLNISRWLIQKFDISKIQKRRECYQELLKEFNLIAIFKTIPLNVVPLGFPVVLNDRDNTRRKLGKNNIFCPIHWESIKGQDVNIFSESIRLSQNVLTIPFCFNRKYFNRIVNVINSYISIT